MTANSEENVMTDSDEEDILTLHSRLLREMMAEITPESLAVMQSLTRYVGSSTPVGFDPKQTLSIIEAVEDSEKVSNICKMIVIFLTRGNKVSSIKEKCSANVRHFLNKVIIKYKLQDNTGQKGPNVMSLSRIAASHPMLTLKLIKAVPRIQTSRPVKITEMEIYSKNFPPVLMTTIAASVVPKGDCLTTSEREAVINAIVLYCMLETRKLNRAKANDSWRELSAHCLTYVNASHNSSLLNETKRKDFCASTTMEDVFTVTSGKLTVKTAVLDASKAYEDLINSVQ